jgi:hypothetical protein
MVLPLQSFYNGPSCFFFCAAPILSRFALTVPVSAPDSAISDEVAVSAPNGIIMSDTAALAMCVVSLTLMTTDLSLHHQCHQGFGQQSLES